MPVADPQPSVDVQPGFNGLIVRIVVGMDDAAFMGSQDAGSSVIHFCR